MKTKIVLALVLIAATALYFGSKETAPALFSQTEVTASTQDTRQVLEQLPVQSGSRPVAITKEKPPVSGEVAQRLRWLNNKIIKTSAEQSEWEDLLSNPRSLAAATDRLKQKDTSLPLNEDQRQRLDAGLILIRALEWKANPSATQVVSKVEELMNDNSLDQIQDLSTKRSLAADRIELYVVLRDNYPNAAERLARHASGLQARLIEFANNRYQTN